MTKCDDYSRLTDRRGPTDLGRFGMIYLSGLADLLFHSGALGARLRIDRNRELVCVFLVYQSSAQTVDPPNMLFQKVDEMFPVSTDR